MFLKDKKEGVKRNKKGGRGRGNDKKKGTKKSPKSNTNKKKT